MYKRQVIVWLYHEIPSLIAGRSTPLYSSAASDVYKRQGVDIVSIDKGNVCVSLTIKHEHTNVYGIAHGGVIMSLCDMAMGAACLSVGKKVVTLDFNINILKSIDMEDAAIVKGMIIHNGRSTVVAECEVFNKDNKLCAKARGTFFVIGRLASE